MPFFSGFAQGASDELTRQRQMEAQKTEADAARENAALTHLASSPDPEIAAHAITGLLSSSTRKPGKGLLSGLFGQTEQNPMLDSIKGLIQQGRPMPGNSTEAAQGTMGQQPPAEGPQQEGAPLPSRATTPAVAGPPSTAGAAPAPTSPRQVFRTPDQQIRLNEEATVQGKLAGIGGTSAAADPAIRAHLLGLPIHYTTDAQGNTHTFAGTQEIGATAATGKPSRPEEAIESQAQNLLAAGRYPTIEAARTAARSGAAEATAATQATAGSRATITGANAAVAPQMAAGRLALTDARISAAKDTAIAQYQKRTGTVPATRVQAIAAARSMLGTNPDVTVENVGQLADAIYGAGQGGAAASAPPRGPVSAAAPPPGPTTAPAKGKIAGAIPPDLAGQVRAPKFYSPAGKSTVMAISSMEPMLDQLSEAIKAEGLSADNNPIGEAWNGLLYRHGIDPGQMEEQRLQLAGMSEAYGLKGLLAGRANLPLQNILKQHLVEPGDSPQLILRKIQQLKEAFPVVMGAVNKAENMRVGGGGSAAAGAPPAAASGKITVKAPDGSLHPFDTQAQADAFKKLAGIK